MTRTQAHRLREVSGWVNTPGGFPDLAARTLGRTRRIRGLRPDGPLAITYARGGFRIVGERFDLVFASRNFTPLDVRYRYADAIAAGNDYAVILASLHVGPTPLG